MNSSMEAKVYSWDDLPQDAPIPLLERRMMHGSHIVAARVLLHKGCRVNTHQHDSEQFVFIQSGRLRFGIGEEGSPDRHDVVVNGGDFLHLPPNIPHSADAEEDTWVVDILSPIGQMGIDRQGTH
jgi:quercetin dioxygenase-like cupin family protein